LVTPFTVSSADFCVILSRTIQPHDCVWLYRKPSPRIGMFFTPQEQSHNHKILLTVPDLIDL
jgi:hypothetical protein